MMNKYVVINVIIWCFLMGCTNKSKENRTIVEDLGMVDYFTNNGFGNAVAIVQHPAGVYHNGITYVAYQGPFEDPYVASYNHKTKEWKGPFKAGISTMGKDPNRKKKIDNHGKPGIIIDDAGYIHIAFGGHGGTPDDGDNLLGNYHYGRNLHAVSKKPLDISVWETLDNISVFGTYSQFIKMDNGDIYLFYRHGAHRSNWVYQKSTDNGNTFGEPISFLKHKRRTDAQAEDSWYPWVSRGNGDDIIVAFDYHICRDRNNTQDERGHIPERHNLYYMVFDTKSGQWKNVKNEPLVMPLTKEMADAKTLVSQIADDWTFQGVTDVDSNGNAYVGVQVGPEIGANRSGPKRIQLFKWDGKEWLQSNTDNLPKGDADIEALSSNHVNIYLEGKTTDDVTEISRWRSSDDGKLFKKDKIFLQRKNSGFVISSIIDNPHPDARMVAGEKEKGTYFRKMYLIGDNGPIKRSKKEANVLKQ